MPVTPRPASNVNNATSSSSTTSTTSTLSTTNTTSTGTQDTDAGSSTGNSGTSANGSTTFDSSAGSAQPLPTGGALPGSTTALALQAARMGVDPALIAKLANPAELKKTVEGFTQLIVATDGAAITKKQEKQIWQTLAALSAAGMLIPAVTMLVDEGIKAGALPANLPPAKKQSLVEQFAGLIEAELGKS